MQRTLILAGLAALIASSAVFAQPETNHVVTRAGTFGFQARTSAAAVQGAPYTATITNESVQTLADGNRIVQTSTGTTARDSMGRTRQDAPLPTIGNMTPADAPHLVFLQDPVAQVSYTLNLTDKTAMKVPSFAGFAGGGAELKQVISAGAVFGAAVRIRDEPYGAAPAPQTIAIQKAIPLDEGQAQTEDLGSKVMEGVNVTGTRVTRTIPAGQIGNDKPISIVTEVWTSPELKTVVYSERSDPRMGDQTFKLTNIVRSEPDPTLFTVPGDFKIVDAQEPIMYKTSGGPAQ